MADIISTGQRIVHTARPEWGVGTVTAARPAVHDGAPCQSLTIRFERGGLKTLSTGVAPLALADASAAIPASAPSSDAGWLSTAEQADPLEVFTAIPEAARDPFASERARLEATLDLYRFSGVGASLLDWAAVQSGMVDPLSRFARHELEEYFRRFRQNLDAHLRQLARSVRRSDPAAFERLLADAPADARRVV